jgi:hypothetical protein
MDTYVKWPQCYSGQRVCFLIPDFRLGQTYVFVSKIERYVFVFNPWSLNVRSLFIHSFSIVSR